MQFGIREAVFVIVLLGMPVASWWLVFEPNNRQIDDARAEVLAKRQKLGELESATRHIDDLGREIDRLSEAIELFEAKLPAEKEVEIILKEVWQLAARHGLKPRSVRVEQPVAAARYSELPLRMVIMGDFDGFYSFLLDLERLSRITRVPQMKLDKLMRGEEGEMEASFTLSIFFEPQLAADAGT